MEVKTNETLSDKKQWFLHDMDDYNSGKWGYYDDDVREAIKKLKEEINKFAIHRTGVHAGFLVIKMNEIFGSFLCEVEE